MDLSTQSPRTLASLRTGFSPVFWVANTLELFERLAFYGSKAVLSVYLADKVGLELATVGWLVGIFSGLLYSLPIIAGVFVDRYGFRRTLATCFALFTIGYFLIGVAGMELGQSLMRALGKTQYVATVLILTAAGGSLIKPCIVGTVERTARPDYRALGFSIYYALVNLGGAIGPIIATGVRGAFGIEYVLVMSAITSALMLAGTLLFFREPVAPGDEPERERSFAHVFRDMVLVFGNVKFIAFLVVFSGFWVMFWQIFYSFPFYVNEILGFKRFEILETVDAWTIILLSVPLTALAKRMRAMPAMVLGFLIASCSWLIIAFMPTVTGAVGGLFFFAVGEALQAPRFYDYVGRIAPREQVGTFMGFAFLPVAIGSVIAGRLGAWLVEHYVRRTVDPMTMWTIVAAVGFAATALMFAYDRVVGPVVDDKA
ncbi:MAG TPA: MFS transporter [Bryobacteraceae bacterium]|nr:MFS transporter [Bryobacteraceae bacterium]